MTSLNPFLNPRPKKLIEASIQGGLSAMINIFNEYTLIIGEVSGEFTDVNEDIVYKALSGVRPSPGKPHAIVMTNNPSFSTFSAEGWTWYYGDHPTGTGGHGTGTGVGRVEFIVHRISSPLSSVDWFIHIGGHKANPTPGDLWVRRGDGPDTIEVPLGYFVIVDKLSISRPALIGSNRSVADFVTAVLSEVDGLSL